MADVSQIDFSRKRTFGQSNVLTPTTQVQSESEDGENDYEDHDQEGQDPDPDAECTNGQSAQASPSSPEQAGNKNENGEDDDEPEPDIKPKRSLFSCDVCNATFVTSLSLKRHNLVYHEDEEAIQCPSCQRMFFNQDDLTMHIADEHEHSNQKGKLDAMYSSDQDSDGLEDDGAESVSAQEAKDEAEDESEIEEPDLTNDGNDDMNEAANYTRLDKLCGGADDDDDLDEQPVSDPFADEEDEIPEEGVGEAYNEFGDGHVDDEQDLGSFQGGSSLSSLIEPEANFQEQQQFQALSLLRKAFNQSRQATSFNRGNAQGHGQKAQPHICPECGAGFMTRVNMQRHMLSHGQDRPHKCQLCDKGFVRKEHLFKHLSSVHSGLKFTCEFCGKDISRKDHLLRHIRHVHPSEYLRIPPELLNAQNLESLSSDNLRAAGFEISDKALNSMQPKPKKPFLNCDMCPATFTLLNDLYTHQSEAHSDVRKHKCPDCPKAFKRREHLTKHEVLHSGAKKFRCALCGKAFPRKDALTDHVRRLHSTPVDNGSVATTVEADNFPGVEYPCSFCDKVFLQQENLIRHLRSMHRISMNLPGQMVRPVPAAAAPAAGAFNPMNLGVARIAPKPKPAAGLAVAVRPVSRVSQYTQQKNLLQAQMSLQSQSQPKLKPILPKHQQPKQDTEAVTSLRQAQQHLNKISGGKSSITISAVPAPTAPAPVALARPRVAVAARPQPQAAAPRVASAIRPAPAPAITRPTYAVISQPPTQNQNARYQAQMTATAVNTVNKIVIKKIGEYMKATPVPNIATLPTISVVNNVNGQGQVQVQQQRPVPSTTTTTTTALPVTPILPSFPCSYCNAVYSDEKIFRIHMNSHNADMN